MAILRQIAQQLKPSTLARDFARSPVGGDLRFVSRVLGGVAKGARVVTKPVTSLIQHRLEEAGGGGLTRAFGYGIDRMLDLPNRSYVRRRHRPWFYDGTHEHGRRRGMGRQQRQAPVVQRVVQQNNMSSVAIRQSALQIVGAINSLMTVTMRSNARLTVLLKTGFDGVTKAIKKLGDDLEWMVAGASRPNPVQNAMAAAGKARTAFSDRFKKIGKRFGKFGSATDWLTTLLAALAVGGLAWTMFKDVFSGDKSLIMKGLKAAFGSEAVDKFTKNLKEGLIDAAQKAGIILGAAFLAKIAAGMLIRATMRKAGQAFGWAALAVLSGGWKLAKWGGRKVRGGLASGGRAAGRSIKSASKEVYSKVSSAVESMAESVKKTGKGAVTTAIETVSPPRPPQVDMPGNVRSNPTAPDKLQPVDPATNRVQKALEPPDPNLGTDYESPTKKGSNVPEPVKPTIEPVKPGVVGRAMGNIGRASMKALNVANIAAVVASVDSLVRSIRGNDKGFLPESFAKFHDDAMDTIDRAKRRKLTPEELAGLEKNSKAMRDFFADVLKKMFPERGDVDGTVKEPDAHTAVEKHFQAKQNKRIDKEINRQVGPVQPPAPIVIPIPQPAPAPPPAVSSGGSRSGVGSARSAQVNMFEHDMFAWGISSIPT